MSALSLATLNALLNATAAVLIGFGYVAIKQKKIERHKRFMIAAFGTSVLFLGSYLARNLLYGDVHFVGTGLYKIVYFAILISHVVLAAVVAPLVVGTLALGLRRNVPRHRRLARVTFPIWAYVSVTGVLVYLMLYHG